MGDCWIRKLDHTEAAVRDAIIAYLRPVEPHALFILGNLLSGFAGSHYYVAERNGEWAGITGYFDRPKSTTPYSQEEAVVRALTHHVARLHPQIDYMNAMGFIGAAACDELRRLGYEPANDPRQVFMEAEMPEPPARAAGEELVRRARPGEEYAVADLMRYLSRPEDPSPPTAAEVARQVLTFRFIAEVDGRPVATATTNGQAIRCFQILGVVTHPEYRRRGLATALCAAVMRDMYARGARHAVLFTGVENTSAQRCYERLGFRVTGDYLVAKFRRPEGSSQRKS